MNLPLFLWFHGREFYKLNGFTNTKKLNKQPQKLPLCSLWTLWLFICKRSRRRLLHPKKRTLNGRIPLSQNVVLWIIARMGSVGSYLAFIRYLVSGVSSVVVQFVALAFLVEALGIEETFSSGAAFLLACVVNYLMLYYWAFRSTGKHLTAILRYTGVTGFGLLLNLFIFWFLVRELQLWYLLAQSIATLAVSLLTYIINSAYTFSNSEQLSNGE